MTGSSIAIVHKGEPFGNIELRRWVLPLLALGEPGDLLKVATLVIPFVVAEPLYLLWRSGMQQPQATTYADIAEVRTVTGAAACNQLLADGWVLLGVYPLTTVADMEQQPAQGERKQDIQRYVRRLVGYVVGRRRE